MKVKIGMKEKHSSIFVWGSPKIKMILGERRERGATSVVTNSNLPSGAILDDMRGGVE